MEHDVRQAESANPFEWSGGHPALDLVNTLDERPSSTPIENLATYHDLTRFAALAGLLDRRTAARLQRLDSRSGSYILKRARKLREHLHDVLATANSGRPARQPDLDALSAAIQAAHAAQTLVSSPSPGLANRRWSPALTPEIPLHACSLAIECLLVDEDRKRIRKCSASDCDVYYLDTSKGRRRQWCSMKGCGNREKQRRWRSATR
ncbi:putative RNA-binding Zn ribbon-like protein [Bradyrhizobium sp. AZCC 1610]|uniref:CGNR zinc finger domain-containing protein n=1 Tax=Bradyrhizobium sp. AZCC 1610 TaxID=3117020 RepID=UPI002FF232C3